MYRTQKLELQYNKEGKIYSPLGKKYKVSTPEEIIRQRFVCTLVNSYGYSLEQMQEEVKTQKGKNAARADIVIWKSPKDKQDKNPPLIIVECKADTIRISESDYAQGESYARLTNAPFFVTHNSYETRFWRVIKDKMPGFTQEIANIPENNASDKDIDKLLKDLVVFKEDEFAKVLKECHNYIRDNDKLGPSEAFDEIAKILFMKVYVERKKIKDSKSGKNVFNKQYLDELEQDLKSSPLIKTTLGLLEVLFENTKEEFKNDEIFKQDEKIELKNATIEKIIEKLQKYNLSLTSSDIKGIAFEKFLGETFRGQLGQFFTPRPIVEFMIEMINPQENEVSCDPASGSGGFLIRIFSKVRELIQQDIIKQYEAYKKSILKDINNITDTEAKKLNDKKSELEKELETDTQGTRLFKLSNHCIYGTDANDRMARTSKMNMIMHGDGHGGIHHHDGLLNINGIFENRFDIILTNPPFGSNVRKENIIRAEDAQTYLNNNGEVSYTEEKKEQIENYYKTYGKETYQNAQRKILDNIGKPIASLFALKPNLESDKTEHLFINRCLDLLKPGGRMGIVLPEGVFNTPNAEYVREFVEGRAFLRAVISLPQETFISSKASVKSSILFLQKFSQNEQNEFNSLLEKHTKELKQKHKETLDKLESIINYRKAKGEKIAKYNTNDKAQAKKELKELESSIKKQAFKLTKIDFDYPIFMAEPEFVGITSTGEMGENVKNELIDSYEVHKDENGKVLEKILEQKGILSHFREFLQEYNIQWNQ